MELDEFLLFGDLRFREKGNDMKNGVPTTSQVGLGDCWDRNKQQTKSIEKSSKPSVHACEGCPSNLAALVEMIKLDDPSWVRCISSLIKQDAH